MKNYLQKISALVLLGIAFVGCDPSDPTIVSPPPPLFTNTNTSFQQLFDNITSPTGGYVKSTNDYEEQSYDFEMSTNGTIYSFGYSSQTAVANKNYKIELLDASGAVITTVTTTFLDTGSYYTLPTPVAILANTKYTLRRTFYLVDATLIVPTPAFGDPHNFSDIIGPGLVKIGLGTLTLPIIVGNMKITGASSRQVSTIANGPTVPTLDRFIPFIDFAFTP